jgi:hypothetical protein
VKVLSKNSGLTLPEHWQDELSNKHESGMGYQKVNITLHDGTIFRDIIVHNGKHILVCPDGIDINRIEKIDVEKES